MDDPRKIEEWMQVARERGADARSMLPSRPRSVGPVYMAGYAIESALKAYLQARGLPRPRSGQAGHDLRYLWKTANLRLSDLHDDSGDKIFFFEKWTTSLRYQPHAPDDWDSDKLVNAAQAIVTWLHARIKRYRRKRR